MTDQIEYRSTHLLAEPRLKLYRDVADRSVNACRILRPVVNLHRRAA